MRLISVVSITVPRTDCRAPGTTHLSPTEPYLTNIEQERHLQSGIITQTTGGHDKKVKSFHKEIVSNINILSASNACTKKGLG